MSWFSGLASFAGSLAGSTPSLLHQAAPSVLDISPAGSSQLRFKPSNKQQQVEVDWSQLNTPHSSDLTYATPLGHPVAELDAFDAYLNPTTPSHTRTLQQDLESLTDAPLQERWLASPLKDLGSSRSRICTSKSCLRDYRKPHQKKGVTFTNELLDAPSLAPYTKEQQTKIQTQGLDESLGGWTKDARGNGGRVTAERSQYNAELRQGDAWAKMHGEELNIPWADEAPLEDEFPLISLYGSTGLLGGGVDNVDEDKEVVKFLWETEKTELASRGGFTMDDPNYYWMNGAWIEDTEDGPRLRVDPSVRAWTTEQAEANGTKSEFSRLHRQISNAGQKLMLRGQDRDMMLLHDLSLPGNNLTTEEEMQAEHYLGGKVSSSFISPSAWKSSLTVEQALKDRRFGISAKDAHDPSGISHFARYQPNSINPATGSPVLAKSYLTNDALSILGSTVAQYQGVNHVETVGNDSIAAQWIGDAAGLVTNGIKMISTKSEQSLDKERMKQLRDEFGTSTSRKEQSGCVETSDHKCETIWCATHGTRNNTNPTYGSAKSKMTGKPKVNIPVDQWSEWMDKPNAPLANSHLWDPNYKDRDIATFTSAQQTLPTVQSGDWTGDETNVPGVTLGSQESIDTYLQRVARPYAGLTVGG